MLWSVIRLIFKTSSVTPNFCLPFESNFIIFYLQSKFKKNLYVGTFGRERPQGRSYNSYRIKWWYTAKVKYTCMLVIS